MWFNWQVVARCVALDLIPAPHTLGMEAVCLYNPSRWKVDAERSEIQGCPNYKASSKLTEALGPCPKERKNQTKTKGQCPKTGGL